MIPDQSYKIGSNEITVRTLCQMDDVSAMVHKTFGNNALLHKGQIAWTNPIVGPTDASLTLAKHDRREA